MLRLRPGSENDPIIVSLEHVSLEDPTPYKAVSYVWGNGNDLHTITHEEMMPRNEVPTLKVVTVTRNLRDALKHFRHLTNNTTIWADALCIDQQNMSERAQQVRLMRDIYMKADSVLLWLGLEDDNTKMGVQFLEEVANFCQERSSLSILEKANIMGDFSRMLGLESLPQLNEKGALAARAIFDRPWFKRIWVVQEVTAGQAVLVYIGRFQLPFAYLGLGASWIRESQFIATGTGAGCEGMRNAAIMWQKRFGQRESQASLLDDGRDLLATDPRDKVYGLLGFTALRQIEALVPAYEKSVEEVYTDTCLAVIASTCNLDMLSFAENPPCIDNSIQTAEDRHLGWPGTPTWVARWDKETWFPTSAMCELSPHTTRGGPSASLPFTISDKSVLSLKGRYIDEVVYVAPYVSWPRSPDVEPIPMNQDAFLNMWQAISTLLPDVATISLLTAWAQVLTGGITASYQPANNDPAEHCADLIAFMLSVDHGGEDSKRKAFILALQEVQIQLPLGSDSRSRMAMILMLSYRRVFLTKSGYLGLGHSRTRVGDQAVWLFGAKLPFVLRSVESQWRFVGEGFLYNVRCSTMFVFDHTASEPTLAFEIL